MSSKSKLFDMLNAENPAPFTFTESNVTLSPPLPADVEGRNSQVAVTAILGQGYSGATDVYYTRLNLADLGYMGIVSEFPVSAEEILAHLNTVRVAEIEGIDLEQISMPVLETGVVLAVRLTAHPQSYRWIGETEVELLIGIPAKANLLHTFLHSTLPAPNYL